MSDLQTRLRQGFGGMVPPVCDEAANEIDKLRTNGAAQAQEIDELKAHVNELRDLLDYKKWRDKSEPEWIMKKRMVLENAPAQSLSAHDAAIEDEMVKCSITACENEKVGANKFDDRADVAWDDAVTSCISAISDMQRSHNVR